MAANLQTIINILEKLAPPTFTEDWDNSGLQLGDSQATVKRVLLALDVNPEVMAEAIEKEAELIVSHHPLIFAPIKNLLHNTPQGRLLSGLIKNDIAVYSAHTNLDKATFGVNDVLAQTLGVNNPKLLNITDREQYYKLVVFIPVTHTDIVREAIAGAGAGFIGNYSDCAFLAEGTGVFKPLEGTHPFSGEINELSRERETRLETIVPATRSQQVIQAMLKAHPYEEVAYDLYPLKNSGEKNGLGLVGKLAEPVTLAQFTDHVKQVLGLDTVKVGGNLSEPVSKIALCGGSGSGLWKQAVRHRADVFVTGDITYHTAQDMAESGLSFVDAGHYATERPVLDRLKEYLDQCGLEGQHALEIIISDINTDPFKYV